MKLYHGTTGRHLAAILRDGLQPRGKRRGNWAHTTESSTEHVYLTDSYAPYFAMAACYAAAPDTCAVFEIDTDRLSLWNLAPDEDYLMHAHVEPQPPFAGTPKRRTRWYRDRLDLWTDAVTWRASLSALGTCCYAGAVPPAAITRYAVWPYLPNVILRFIFDPQITIANQRICGDRYRFLTAQLFGDVERPTPVPFDLSTADPKALLASFERPALPPIKDLVVTTRTTKAA